MVEQTHEPPKKGKGPVKNLVSTRTSWSRRDVLKAFGLGGLTVATGGAFAGTVSVLSNLDETRASLDFLLQRHLSQPGERYVPTDLDQMLSSDAIDRVYRKLELAEKFPDTLSKESFQVIAQKVARLFNLYFEPKSEDQKEKEQEFIAYCEQTFARMLAICEQQNVDFVATLLMWQTSGLANSSLKKEEQDLTDETVRVMLSLAEKVVSGSSGTTFVSLMRRLKINMFPGMARVEGPVTLGIHDMETIMIARGLMNLKLTNPNTWEMVSGQLRELAPHFSDAIEGHVNLNDEYEELTQQGIELVTEDKTVIEYIQNLDHRLMAELLLNGERVDDYQFLRTTRFWAHICDRQATSIINDIDVDGLDLEKEAFIEALNDYFANPHQFVLDQMTNPRFLQKLTADAREKIPGAQLLLDYSRQLHEKSEQIITADRSIAATLIREKTEQNLEFQLITGVAFTRWLLNEVQKQRTGQYKADIAYSNPDETAYDCFIAVSGRESGATFELAGSRPLDKATKVYQSLEELYAQLQDFITKVYLDGENEEPIKNMRPFLIRLSDVYESPMIRRFVGVALYELRQDYAAQAFVERAQAYGVDEKFFSLPFSSWRVALQGVLGYVAKMGQ